MTHHKASTVRTHRPNRKSTSPRLQYSIARSNDPGGNSSAATRSERLRFWMPLAVSRVMPSGLTPAARLLFLVGPDNFLYQPVTHNVLVVQRHLVEALNAR